MDSFPTPLRRSLAARLVLLGAAAVYAALALGSGLDRMSASHGRVAGLVPEPFRVVSLQREAGSTADAGNVELTEALAARLVSRNPASAGAAGLLGAAREAKGDAAGAEQAYRAAAAWGWRDARTQLYWLKVALDSRDFETGALRFEALARQWPNAPALYQLADAFEAEAEARAALVQRIVAGAPWARSYALMGENPPEQRLRHRSEVLLAAGQNGRILGCDTIARAVRGLAGFDPVAASALWRMHCPPAGGPGLIADPRFRNVSSGLPQVPFAWEFPGDGALDVSPVPQGPGNALAISSSSALTLPVAAQLVPLAPGTYRLSWSSRAEQGPASGKMLASLSCGRERMAATPTAGAGDGNAPQVVEFTVSGQCAASWLQFWVPPGAGKLMLEEVELRKL